MSDYREFIGEYKSSPVEIFQAWFHDALEIEENGSAFILSTVDSDNRPNARTLLLKEVTEEGPLFFTNYTSTKGDEIASNPNVALTFYWHKLGKQVRIRGKARKCSKDISESYFHSRAIESQVASFTSKQSRPVSDRKKLKSEYQENLVRYNKEVPYPSEWGGYLVDIEELTFFIYGEHRLNDRFQFIKKGSEWESLRLYP